jgi:hypothetical protein
VVGGSKNCEVACVMLRDYAPERFEIVNYGKSRFFIRDVDVVINFGCHLIPLLKLITARGIKVGRLTGTDYYGKLIHRLGILLFSKLPFINFIFSSHNIKDDSGLDGVVLHNPVNEKMFYDMGIQRDIAVLYYVNQNRELYREDTVKPDWVVIRGEVDYRDMPLLYNRSKVHVRNTLYDSGTKMIYEAFCCGCQVFYNGRRVESVPDFMLSSVEIPKWFDYLESLVDES